MALSTTIPDRISIARETKIYFVSGTTVSTAGSLETIAISGAAVSSGSIISALVKNITITPPENPQELNSFLGVDTSSFQNQLFQTKPPTEAKLTGTLILDANETFEPIFGGGGTAITGGFTRYQIGNNTQVSYSAVIAISGAGSSTKQANIGLFNSIITKWGDIKLSGPDGHWEQDVSIVCLPKNFHVEYKD